MSGLKRWNLAAVALEVDLRLIHCIDFLSGDAWQVVPTVWQVLVDSFTTRCATTMGSQWGCLCHKPDDLNGIGIFTYIWRKFMENIGYSIGAHGSYIQVVLWFHGDFTYWKKTWVKNCTPEVLTVRTWKLHGWETSPSFWRRLNFRGRAVSC